MPSRPPVRVAWRWPGWTLPSLALPSLALAEPAARHISVSPPKEKSMPDRAAATPLGPLPEWDLTDLYPGMDSPQLAADLETATAEATALAERYRGKLASLDGAGLAAAIGAYEKLDERLSRIMSYAQLVHAGNVMDNAIGRFYQSTQERVTDISAITLFFTLELNRIDDATMARQLADPALAHYAPWIHDSRAYRP